MSVKVSGTEASVEARTELVEPTVAKATTPKSGLLEPLMTPATSIPTPAEAVRLIEELVAIAEVAVAEGSPSARNHDIESSTRSDKFGRFGMGEGGLCGQIVNAKAAHRETLSEWRNFEG